MVESDGALDIGITEPNPAFVRPDGDVPEPFDRWRDALLRMRPRFWRLVVDWAGVSSRDGREIDLAKPNPGCMRDVEPCGGYAGVRDQLRAVAAAQKASDGEAWQVLVVISGTPEGLASDPNGCERAGTEPRSRPPTDRGLAVYGKLVTRLLDEAREAGAELRYWSPWNEPNHPYGLSPQRTRCDRDAPSAATEPYARLAHELERTLDEEPGEQTLVLGETAGLLRRKPAYVRVQQFIRELPRDIVCAAPIYGQHGYVGGPDPIDEVADALARHRCAETHQIWMTETGVGAPRRGERRGKSRAEQRHACLTLHRRLVRWYEDPRVTAAFQYTLREDDRFRTGLVTADLDDAYPALAEWQAWGRRAPEAPPPAAEC